jgi:hypothetical protein
MPTISAFRGILIRMYFDDHFPPHFHALYQGDEAKIAIATLEVIDGGLPQRMLRYVVGWAEPTIWNCRKTGRGRSSTHGSSIFRHWDERQC